jgi:hypothetical protein
MITGKIDVNRLIHDIDILDNSRPINRGKLDELSVEIALIETQNPLVDSARKKIAQLYAMLRNESEGNALRLHRLEIPPFPHGSKKAELKGMHEVQPYACAFHAAIAIKQISTQFDQIFHWIAEGNSENLSQLQQKIIAEANQQEKPENEIEFKQIQGHFARWQIAIDLVGTPEKEDVLLRGTHFQRHVETVHMHLIKTGNQVKVAWLKDTDSESFAVISKGRKAIFFDSHSNQIQATDTPEALKSALASRLKKNSGGENSFFDFALGHKVEAVPVPAPKQKPPVLLRPPASLPRAPVIRPAPTPIVRMNHFAAPPAARLYQIPTIGPVPPQRASIGARIAAPEQPSAVISPAPIAQLSLPAPVPAAQQEHQGAWSWLRTKIATLIAGITALFNYIFQRR